MTWRNLIPRRWRKVTVTPAVASTPYNTSESEKLKDIEGYTSPSIALARELADRAQGLPDWQIEKIAKYLAKAQQDTFREQLRRAREDEEGGSVA